MKWILGLLAILALIAPNQGQTLLTQVCSADRMMTDVEPNANILLGGIFEIRAMGENGIGCGKPVKATMQIFEATRYALNIVNNFNGGAGYVSNVKFGMHAYDVCFSPPRAVTALQLLYPQTSTYNVFCTKGNQVMPGVIGPLTSDSSKAVASFAGQIPVSLISPYANSPELSDKFKYPSFLRTTPSLTVFARAVVELLKQLQWENIIVAYIDDSFGRGGKNKILEASVTALLCVSRTVAFPPGASKDEIKAILNKLGSNPPIPAVLVAPDGEAKLILEAVNEVPNLSQMEWILSDLDASGDISNLARARGAIVVASRSPFVPGFRQYFTERAADPRNNVGNPWFEDWYEETYGCSLTGTTNNCPTQTQATLSSAFVQSPYAVAAMMSVIAYAETVRSICPSGGVCQALQNMSPATFHDRLKNLDFIIPNNFPVSELIGQRIAFDANGDPVVSEFTVFNYNNRNGNYGLEEIGRYTNGALTLDRQPIFYDANSAIVSPTSTCADVGCRDCLLPSSSYTYRYQSGDLVIASLVNAHLQGVAAYTCGKGDESRLAALVAAEWAVTQYKASNTNKLRQVSLGSLVVDVCPHRVIAQGFLTELLSGANRLTDQSGAVIPYRNIKAFVDQTDSGQARVIGPILSHYQIPEVESGATSPDLANDVTSPYFTRVVPNDEVYFTAVSSVLQRLNWKYVQVATYASGRFNSMLQTFKKVAAKHGICIVGTTTYFSFGGPNRYDRTLTQLLDNDESNIVIVIGESFDSVGLLAAIRQRGVIGKLQLIAGNDRWARDLAFIRGEESAAVGTIVLDRELTANANFQNYLSGLSLNAIATNPFLMELFELTNKCSLSPSTRGMYNRTCTNSDSFNIYQGSTPYVIQSVYAVADQLHELIAEICNDINYSGLCEEFRSATDIGTRLDARLQNLAKRNGFGTKNGEATTNILFYVYKQTGFSQMGQFNTENMELVSADANQLENYNGRISQCSGGCMQCQYMFALQNGYYMYGDWLIAGAFSVSNPGDALVQPYICGVLKQLNGPQFTMAMLYALQQVNSGKASVSVPGVNFGGLIFDHCNNPGRANLLVSDVYSGMLMDMGWNPDRVLAWLTDNTVSTHEAAQLLDPLGIAIVSPSATSASLLQYPEFHRTIQGDATVATALVKIIRTLGFQYFQVALAANAYGRDALATLQAVAQSEGICITNSFELTSNNSAEVVTKLISSETKVVVLYMGTSDTQTLLQAITNNTVARSSLLLMLPEPFSIVVEQYSQFMSNPIISLQLQSSVLQDYIDYLNKSPTSNPYFAKYYMSVKQCNLPGYFTYSSSCPTPLAPITNDARYVEDNFILSTINAVYAVVDALDRTVREKCGDNYAMPCAGFYAAQDKRDIFNRNLKQVTFVDEGKRTFRFLNREGNSVYSILQSNSAGKYTEVGKYDGVSLEVSDAAQSRYPNVTSYCQAPCLGCIMTSLNFSHIPGDIYLAGMFDVHHSSLSPFTCGKIQTLHGFLLLEAFNFAITKVNDKKDQFSDVLRGTRLGGIGLDACSSHVRGGYLVSNIHSGLVSLAKDGVLVTPSKIDAYIGAYESKASLYLARILTDLEIPQISYNSGSEELSDTRIYPWFYRTVPSDINEVEAMLKFMDMMDIRYVQILYEDNSNGISAKDYFIANAARHRICVAQAVSYPDLGIAKAETSNERLTRLMEKASANTVVTFLSTIYVNSVLKAVQDSASARNNLRFFGSTSWADNEDAIRGALNAAKGSITIKLDSDDVDEFERYVDSRTLANSGDNPWFGEYYQEILGCYLSKANTMGYPRPCTQASIINSPFYQQDPGVVDVINAVYAAAFAMHETLKEKCGDDYTSVCQTYLNDAKRRELTRDNLANVNFTDPVGKKFMFVDRSGISSYRFNYIESGTVDGVTYREIGLYNVTSGLVTVSPTYSPTWNSGCEREDACAECPAIRDSDKRYFFYDNGTPGMNIKTIVAFFDIHKQGLDPYRCGDINVPGFQEFLAFMYTLADVMRVDSQRNFRIMVIDTCSNSLRVDQDLFGLLQGEGICNTLDDELKNISMNNLAYVITAGEANTIAASRVLEAPRIPYISPDALSPVLDDKTSLARTIAPINAVMKALASFLQGQGWTYIDVVYENSAWGLYPYQEFAHHANELLVCRGSNIMISPDNTDAEIVNMFSRLNGATGSKAVVLMGSEDFVRRVLSVAYDLGIADDYVWVLGVEWDVTDDFIESVAEAGAHLLIVVVQRWTDTVSSFDSYKQISYAGVNRPSGFLGIPHDWFNEFYQTLFGCTLANSSKPINVGEKECNTTWAFTDAEDYVQDKYVLNTIAATYAAISALDTCNQQNCDLQNREDIMSRLLNVVWDGTGITLQNTTARTLGFRFDKVNRWWDQGYVIRYLWVPANGGDVVDEKLYSGPGPFDSSRVLNIKNKYGVAESQCLESSSDGGCGCSYEDFTSPFVQKRVPAADHRNYYKYDSTGTDLAYDWPVWAITVAVLTSVGLVIAIILFLILLCAYPKKGGTSVLGYMAIIGIICIYAINFAFFVHATDATCGIRRFLMGVVYMIAMAPLLIKAVDNWRYARVEYGAERYSGISSAFSLFLIALLLVVIQCIIPIMWLILVHPTASEWAPLDNRIVHDNWWCDPKAEYDVGLVQSFIFVMFIILVTSVFAALGYDTDRNNFESRWILFACICTAGCFLVWMIVSTNAGPPYRDASVTIGNFVNATLLLLLLPLRKTVLLCRSLREKEEKEDAMEVINGGANYDLYSNSFENPTFDIADYDNEYINTKPSEF